MKNIGVFFGSKSTEHDISIITAQLVISGLKGLGYNVFPVYISKTGKWLISENLGQLKTFTEGLEQLDQEKKLQEYYLDLEFSQGKIVLKEKKFMGKVLQIDIVFPAFHGSYGEDGKSQGIFEMLNVPYVGCDVVSSAISMDKALTKQICQVNGLPITKFLVFEKKDWDDKKKLISAIKRELRFPVFIKPVHLGSSIGISKVKDEKDLEEKLELAFYYDDKVLVEESVEDVMDVTCCVIGNDKLEASLLQESNYQADLFDFEEKYLKGGQFGKSQSSIKIPATLDSTETQKIQETAKEVFQIIGCSGIARIDFLFDKKKKNFYVNEINPLPGTLYHHLWKESGLELNLLLEKLIDWAIERNSKKTEYNSVFNSSVLSNLKSAKTGGKLNQK